MIDARSRRGLVPALLGLVLGVAALAADLPVLGLLAGLCALIVTVLTLPARSATPSTTPTPTAPASTPVAPPGTARSTAPATPATPAAAAPPTVAAASTGASAGPGATGGSDTPERPHAAAPATPGEPAAEPAGEVEPALGVAPASSLVNEYGLFSEEYFLLSVETRVSAARRHLRPVAVILLETGSHRASDHTPSEAMVATAIRSTLREADTACKLSDGRYGFVLEDTPEDGALWTMERFRRTLQAADPSAVRWAGIACYPAHAFSADGVLVKAEAALAAAKEWGQDRVEVAGVD